MSLVDKDHMTELRDASAALETALTAVDDTQLKAVAFVINNASNTGETRVIYQSPLTDEVRSQLESKGYKVEPMKGTAKREGQEETVISWGI